MDPEHKLKKYSLKYNIASDDEKKDLYKKKIDQYKQKINQKGGTKKTPQLNVVQNDESIESWLEENKYMNNDVFSKKKSK
jgi:hypothetical protein